MDEQQKTPEQLEAEIALQREQLAHTVDELTAAQQKEGAPPAEGADDADRQPAAIKLGRKIGLGPVGSSYQGELKDHPHPVAVKVISQRFAKHPELLARILEAMRKAEGLVDPRIVGVLRVVHVAGRDAAVSELCPGTPLREVLRARKRLPADEVLELLRDVALALQQGRGRELSHGDVRPEKVYVTPGGPARLADFGFAEAAGLGANFGQFGVPWGHPDYLAPEVVQGEIWAQLPAVQAGKVLEVDSAVWIGGVGYGAAFEVLDEMAEFFASQG